MDMNRKTAFDALLEIQTKNAYSNIAVNRAVEKNQPTEPAFVRNLVYGVLENRMLLDHCLAQLIKKGLKGVKPKALILLRLGAFQLECSGHIPDYAAINETVAIAKKVCRGLEGFINGVLRSYSREKGRFVLPDVSVAPADYLSVRYSYHPDIAAMWLEMYGFERAEAMMQAGNRIPPLTVRVNRTKTTVAALRQALEQQGFQVQTPVCGEAAADAFLAETALHVTGSGLLETDAYRSGLFSIQDISSMRAIHALNPQPGERILDVCAAPGGKTLLAAEYTGDQAELTACDIHPHKIPLMEKAAERLGIRSVRFLVNDAAVLNEQWVEAFDRVIVDAPCSGLGVVRRKPEIKLHMTRDDIRQLSALQLRILETSAQYVHSGGFLLYSTCTVSKYENERVVKKFFQKNNRFRLLEEKQLFPDTDSSDGFYFSVLQRIL